MLCTYVLGLIAHAYAYFGDAFSHDSLSNIYSDIGRECWKIQLGRILVPVYRFLTRGGIELPSVIGLLALSWLGLAVYIVVHMFNVHSRRGIALLSGLMVTNATVSTITATYIFDLDYNMLSILLACLAAYLWKTSRHWLWCGSLCVFSAVGIYQCNISVTIVLIVMDCIIALLCGDDAWKTVKRGLRGIAMIAVGAVIYVITLQTVLHFTGTEIAQGYNSIANAVEEKSYPILQLIKGTYVDAIMRNLLLWKRIPRYVFFVLPLGFITGGLIVLAAVRNRIKWQNLLLTFALICFLPLGANAAYVLNDGVTHDLMKYAVWLIPAFPVLLWHTVINLKMDWKKRFYRICRNAALCLLCGLLFQNIVLSNSLYLKKSLEQKATLSFMTRLTDDLYDVDCYQPGVTKVCIIGRPELSGKMPGFESLYGFTGVNIPSSTTHYGTYEGYFQYVLNLPVHLVSRSEQSALMASDEIKAMPSYPAEGSMRWIGEILVIKLN